MKKFVGKLLLLVLLFSFLSGCVTTGGDEIVEEPIKEEVVEPVESEIKEEEPEAIEVKTEESEPLPSRDDVNLYIAAAFISSDAHGNRSVAELTWRSQIYEPLFYFNENTLEYEPRIATSYEVSEDGLVYTFRLRNDVKFHNGEGLKASDVVFSVNHIKQSDTWKTFWSNVDFAEAVDDYTVAIHFLSKSAAAMNNISQIWIISEKEALEQGEAFGTKACLAGTGPYYIESFEPETKVVLRAFPDYYRGEAAIKTVNYHAILDTGTATIALEAGELDYSMLVPISSYNDLKDSDELKSEVVPTNHITYLFINAIANKALENDNVRKAIAYAIDKEALSIAAFDGYAVPADYMENPKYNVGAPMGDVVYNYDPEKAKSLLAEAGYEQGVNVGTLLTSTGSYWGDVAVVIQANLAEVGITIDIELMESAAAIAAYRAQEYEVGLLGYTSTGDYDSFRQRAHSETKGAYFVKFEGDKFDYKYFDQLFAEQLNELDLQKRLEITKKLNDAVMETACLLPLFNKVLFVVWDKNLNVVNAPNFPMVYDWSWN